MFVSLFHYSAFFFFFVFSSLKLFTSVILHLHINISFCSAGYRSCFLPSFSTFFPLFSSTFFFPQSLFLHSQHICSVDFWSHFYSPSLTLQTGSENTGGRRNFQVKQKWLAFTDWLGKGQLMVLSSAINQCNSSDTKRHSTYGHVWRTF